MHSQLESQEHTGTVVVWLDKFPSLQEPLLRSCVLSAGCEGPKAHYQQAMAESLSWPVKEEEAEEAQKQPDAELVCDLCKRTPQQALALLVL